MSVYHFAKQRLTLDRPQRSLPEHKLWAAVVEQAIDDLFYCPKTKDPKGILNSMRIRASARHFLFDESPDVSEYRRFVFDSAGLNFDVGPEGLRLLAEEFEAAQGGAYEDLLSRL